MKVSVIMPVYNAQRWLAASVASVQQQTYQNWELLIVDDCSTDGSGALASSLAANDDRIRVFRLTASAGAAAARNKAIEEAVGRYIAFLDSDDLWHPQKLEHQLAFMHSHGYAFTYTAYEKIDEQGQPFQQVRVPATVAYSALLKTNVIGCLTAMYDTAALGKVYMPSNTQREDFATWLHLLKKISYAHGIPVALAQYRVYAGQTSAKKITMAKHTWHLYRDIEQLGLLTAAYYFTHYAVKGICRNRRKPASALQPK